MRASELLRRTPLRVKLVAAVLVLVTLALLVISVASTVALRSYLTGRIDQQLVDLRDDALPRGTPASSSSTSLRSDYFLGWQLRGGINVIWKDERYSPDDLPLPDSMEDAASRAGEPYTAKAPNGGSNWRVLVTMLQTNRPGEQAALVVGQDMSDVDSAVSQLIRIELVVGGAVVLLLAALGVAAVRTSLRPLGEIEQTAGAIAAGDLSQRVPDPEPGTPIPRTEVGRLARSLNAMLAQIESAFAARAASEQRMRQFVADASHELRTPLTTIRGFAELYRQVGVSSPAEAGRLVKRIEDEASRMGLLVEDLLLLARLDQERPLELAPVELPVIVSDAVHAARAVDPQRPIKLEVHAGGVPLVVRGDDARLRQVVSNLLNNALTHTPAGTPVTVRLRAEPGLGVIEVADEGPGLPPEQAARIFERFYRVDSARTRPATAGAPDGGAAASGSGLGLAIVSALVAAHWGTVEVDSAPGAGATFRVRIPLAPAGYTGDAQDGSSRIKE